MPPAWSPLEARILPVPGRTPVDSKALGCLPMSVSFLTTAFPSSTEDEDSKLKFPWYCHCNPAENTWQPLAFQVLVVVPLIWSSFIQPQVFLPLPSPSNSTNSSPMSSGCPWASSVPMAKPGRLAVGHMRIPSLSCPGVLWLLLAMWWHCDMGWWGPPAVPPTTVLFYSSIDHPLDEGGFLIYLSWTWGMRNAHSGTGEFSAGLCMFVFPEEISCLTHKNAFTCIVFVTHSNPVF